jgi:tRNA modification GTPase
MSVIACLLTGDARAAIATICVSGPAVSTLVTENFKAAFPRPIASHEVRFGIWHGGKQDADDTGVAESIVVVRVASSQSSQSSQSTKGYMQPSDFETWEIHCHGGAAATRRILEDLERTGATIVAPEAWQQACGIDLLAREATSALANTTTTRTAAIALDQVRGSFSHWINQLLERLKNGESMDSLGREVRAVLRFADFGLHLTKPWEVVLAGAPNVGKSSLINALVGYTRSITLDQPGTTRDVLKAHAVIDGWPILLFDTAGVRDNPGEDIERQGIELAKATIQNADLVIWVEDGSTPGGAMQQALGTLPRRSLQVFNKIDLHSNESLHRAADALETSATTGEGLDQLRRRIVQTLIPEVPKPGSPVPICLRQIVGLTIAAETDETHVMVQALEELRQK